MLKQNLLNDTLNSPRYIQVKNLFKQIIFTKLQFIKKDMDKNHILEDVTKQELILKEISKKLPAPITSGLGKLIPTTKSQDKLKNVNYSIYRILITLKNQRNLIDDKAAFRTWIGREISEYNTLESKVNELLLIQGKITEKTATAVMLSIILTATVLNSNVNAIQDKINNSIYSFKNLISKEQIQVATNNAVIKTIQALQVVDKKISL